MKTPFDRGDLLRVMGVGLLFGLPACATTTDITKAPFRATTHLSEATTDAAAVLTQGTTQATKDLTRPIKELVSRMAPGADAKVTEKLAVVVFAIVNHENLRVDIARGGGEYLESFADLIGLPPTSDELASYLADESPAAYENVVDRLLASRFPLRSVLLAENRLADPADPKRLLAGGSPVSIFRSEDGGDSWAPVAGFNDHPMYSKWVGDKMKLIAAAADDPNKQFTLDELKKRGESLSFGEWISVPLARKLIFSKIVAKFGGRLKYACSGASSGGSDVLEKVDQ